MDKVVSAACKLCVIYTCSIVCKIVPSAINNCNLKPWQNMLNSMPAALHGSVYGTPTHSILTLSISTLSILTLRTLTLFIIHNTTQHIYTKHINTQHINTQHINTQHINTHKDTHHWTKCSSNNQIYCYAGCRHAVYHYMPNVFFAACNNSECRCATWTV